MLSSALISCFTVPLISKKDTSGGKYLFKYFLSQLYRRVIILYIHAGIRQQLLMREASKLLLNDQSIAL